MKTILAILVLLILMQSCDIFVSPDKPEPKLTQRQLRAVNNSKDFTEIDVQGAATIYVKKGATHKVELKGPKSQFSYVILRTEGETLICDTYEDLPSNFDVKIYVTMPEITGVDLSGAGAIELSSFGELSNLDIDLSGAGNFKASGSKTKVKRLTVSISGAGEVDALNLIAENVDVSVSGAGEAEVHATKKLEAKVSGVGSIEYEGNPKAHKKISGVGSISKK